MTLPRRAQAHQASPLRLSLEQLADVHLQTETTRAALHEFLDHSANCLTSQTNPIR